MKKDKKKIGLLTPWWTVGNYGQILQAYALQRYLTILGYENYIIKYYAPADVGVERVRNNRYFIYYYGYYLKYLSFHVFPFFDKRGFLKFKNKYFRFSKLYMRYEQLVDKSPSADIYIVGSDQVWGPWFRLEPYFLSFGNSSIKKIAYAASFGREVLSDEENILIKKLVKKLDYIGVREESGIDIFKKIGENRADWVPDPTILLKKNEWEMLLSEMDEKPFVAEKIKVFAYIIGKDNNSEIKKIIDLLSCNDSYVCVSDGNDKMENMWPTIERWISLIKSSEIIITNSFHGTLFSIIFNKRFITVKRRGINSEKMNTRFDTLLKKLSIENRLVEKADTDFISFLMINDINWFEINKNLEIWRTYGRDFIKKALV